jgi:hypothetical protein
VQGPPAAGVVSEGVGTAEGVGDGTGGADDGDGDSDGDVVALAVGPGEADGGAVAVGTAEADGASLAVVTDGAAAPPSSGPDAMQPLTAASAPTAVMAVIQRLLPSKVVMPTPYVRRTDSFLRVGWMWQGVPRSLPEGAGLFMMVGPSPRDLLRAVHLLGEDQPHELVWKHER